MNNSGSAVMPSANTGVELHFKDQVLDRLAEAANVAQFVSFDPNLNQRHSRVNGFSPNHRFADVPDAVHSMLKASPEGLVNIRSFLPEDPKNKPFERLLSRPEDVDSKLRNLASSGLYTIVNETVNEKDGGVSGVALGSILEFAPRRYAALRGAAGRRRAPPRPGSAVSSRRSITSVRPSIMTRTIASNSAFIRSRGDTVTNTRSSGRFIRMIREACIPRFIGRTGSVGSWVIRHLVCSSQTRSAFRSPPPPSSRRVAPFRFGTETGTREYWLRTCPVEQVPGRFFTGRGWADPFRLLAEEDPAGTCLASVLAQEGVKASHSGALIVGSDGDAIIEGVAGRGDRFMLGEASPESLPAEIRRRVRSTYIRARDALGAVRMEWVDDGSQTWVVQLHGGATVAQGRTIFPGSVRVYHRFDTQEGLPALYRLIEKVKDNGEGIILKGNIGVTSHMGDVLRKARIPSMLDDTTS